MYTITTSTCIQYINTNTTSAYTCIYTNTTSTCTCIQILGVRSREVKAGDPNRNLDVHGFFFVNLLHFVY